MSTYNARTMAATGKHGVGRTTDILQQCSDAGCDVVGLQETRRSGHTMLKAGDYMVYVAAVPWPARDRYVVWKGYLLRKLIGVLSPGMGTRRSTGSPP